MPVKPMNVPGDVDAKKVDVGTRTRWDFSHIPTDIPIPNLLELQRESYSRFLQMELLPGERESIGLEEAFRSIFPIKDFRGDCALQYVDYTLGDWSCRCGHMAGLQFLRQVCPHCHAQVIVADVQAREVQCQACGQMSPAQVPRCPRCDDTVNMRVKSSVEECQVRGMTYAVPLKVSVGTGKNWAEAHD